MVPATISAAAAISSSILLQYLASGQSGASELGSEALAWAVLPFLFKVSASFDSLALPKATRASPRAANVPVHHQWAIAASLAVLGLCRTENGILGVWLVISPFVLTAQRYPQTNPLYLSEASDVSTSSVSSLSFASSYPYIKNLLHSAHANTVFTGLLAVIFNLAVTRWHYLDFGISTIPVAVILTVVYFYFMSKPDRDSSSLAQPDANHPTMALSFKVVVALLIALSTETVITAAFDDFTQEVIPTMVMSLAKIAFWFSLSQMTRHVSWCAAIATGPFSIMSTLDPSQQSSEGWALFNVIAACLVLAQVINMLPKQDTYKHVLWVFSLLSLVPYYSSVSEARNAQLEISRFSQHHTHPVENLILASRNEFWDRLQRQSQSLDAARSEYRRRYRMEPPPGFDGWYEYAVLHQSPIIDDFDTIYHSVSPFWKISGSNVTEAMGRLQDKQKLRKNLWQCRFSGQTGKTKCSNPYRSGDRHISLLFKKLLEDLRGALPDVTFLVNHLDEPMVLIPPSSSAESGHEITFADMGHIPTWSSVTKFCAHQQAKVQQGIDRGHQNRGNGSASNFLLPFVKNVSSSMDLCQHPEYDTMYGLFMSPTSFSLVTGLAPILSVGSVSTMGDILFPSAAYIERTFQYDETTDVEWESKRNNVYWAGSTTGGFAADDGWRFYHRQRFVSLAQNLEPQRQHSYLRDEGGVVVRVKSSFWNHKLFDVSMTRIFQCRWKYCRDQKRFFRAQQWADKNEAFRSKLVFDVDGNGISGRYYKLLASKSAPVKQTLFREWHDDRLMPWVHYIPVSQGMEELPELVTYLMSTEAGQQRAKEIAEEGRKWFTKAFREVDFGIYMYRLLLELARLHDPSRPPS